MFVWSWIEAIVLGSQVFGQASMEGCESLLHYASDKIQGVLLTDLSYSILLFSGIVIVKIVQIDSPC